MLNSPGEDIAPPPAADNSDKPDASPVRQIVLIGFVGLYLFGMVWFYAQLPWAAVAGTVVAVTIVISGIIQRSRSRSDAPGPSPDE